MRERVLLIGCGDLGLRVARRFLARGDEVHALRRHPPAGDDSGIQWLQGDITRPDTLPALPQGVTRLIHLPSPGGRDPEAYRGVFVDGLANVLKALDGSRLQRIVFVSSSAVYGEHHGDWVTEDTPPAPQGFNGRVLLEAEAALAAQPVSSTAVRFAGLYGPGRLQLIERLRSGAAGAPVQPEHWANRIHIDDAAAAVVHLALLPEVEPIYIGCDDTPLPLHVLYAELARMIGAPEPRIAPAPANVGSKKLSNARLRASGLTLQWPDSRLGYAALLAEDSAAQA
ncbi:NAD-dependent epimerase/dehydratase family protein [Achromobacter arsenitoxydans]|uniref:NAD dependent epimerase/dehydratase family protein 4 n=1 Tax=Achromobacter arsenitoxydans SY8 TaxID=477184 RepID=H0F5Z8_9BURK|nr:NAD-dependent epimerase/dehydratase family protein [Achromobacter arsenitoxydans]EHK66276.1 NAD dependent epimerase/dehydratase family protein 4 [Achromobacter arsenitoxydans SY8]